MRSKLFLMTTALSVVLGAGMAAAQGYSAGTRDNAETRHDQLSPSQDKNWNARTPRRQTTGQAPASSDKSGATSSGATSTEPNRPTAMRHGQTNSNRNETNKSEQPRMNHPASAQGNEPSNAQGKGPASAQSTTPKQPSSAQSNTQSRPTTASSNQQWQPTSAQRERNERTEGTTANPATTRQSANERGNPTREGERGASHVRLSASLQSGERTRLTHAVEGLHARPAHVNFSVSVGTVVPGRVDLLPLPVSIVAVIPQYRGYDYFVVRDEVVIVEPSTHKIVDVIERGGAHAAVRTSEHRKVHLSTREREIIRKHYTRRHVTTTGAAPRSEQIIVGEDVPETVTIERFPEEIYREVPEVRDYRYVEGPSGIYLVDPDSRRVIEDIE